MCFPLVLLWDAAASLEDEILPGVRGQPEVRGELAGDVSEVLRGA